MENKNTVAPVQNGALPQKPRDPISILRGDLEKMGPEFKKALPEHVTPEKFIRVIITSVHNDPALLSCDRKSLIASAVKCAQDGLLPDGKEAALVRYGNKVQYLPMISGIYKRLRNSGEIVSLTSEVIYQADQFKYWVDHIRGQNLAHEPALFAPGGRGERVGVYAVCRLKDGGCEIEVMAKDEVYLVRDISKSKGGPWSGSFENEMWRKTVIRRLSKRLPLSPDVRKLLERDDDLYDLNKANHADAADAKDKILKLIGADQDADDSAEFEEMGSTEGDAKPASVIVKPNDDPDSFDNFPNGPIK